MAARQKFARPAWLFFPVFLILSDAMAFSSSSLFFASPFFRIHCVDSRTGRGVPLVRLTTSAYLSFYSDSSGIIAFDEPGMLHGGLTYFQVRTDGYSVVSSLSGDPKGDPGVLLRTFPGGNATVVLQRTQHAERLFRLTGSGLYRDTVLTGGVPPIKEPLLSKAGVVGQDSLMALPFKDKVFWFFGDTECPQGPRSTDCQHYGRFTTGATSPFPPTDAKSVAPSLEYFSSNNASDPGGMSSDGLPDPALLAQWNPDGFPHPRAMLAGPGRPRWFNMSTWVGSLTVVTSSKQESRMYLRYVCPNGGPDVLYGLALWDEADEVFRPLVGKSGYSFRYSGAQVVQRLSPDDTKTGHIYYASAFAMERVQSGSFTAFEDPARVEYFTPCAASDRGGCTDTSGDWGWKSADLASGGTANPSGHAYFGPAQEAAAIAAGHLASSDARMQVTDSKTGKPIGGTLSRGSVNWNAFRNRYVLIADRHDAHPSDKTSRYGEIYYCESDAIVGPWTECTVVATHAWTGSSCYNPLQLAWLDEGGGKVVYFACTWTSMSSGGPGHSDRACKFANYGGIGCAVAVPRYEYNNLVFRLDVEDMLAAMRDV